MKYTNQENEISIDVESTFEETRKGFPNDKRDQNYHNHFKITVSSMHGSETFDYYGSQFDCEKGKKVLTDDDLKGALRCIVNDALYGNMSFEEFCGELGYDEDSCRAVRIHKACQNSSGKLQNVILESDWYTIVNDLNEY